jgi:hypothetical protein
MGFPNGGDDLDDEERTELQRNTEEALTHPRG